MVHPDARLILGGDGVLLNSCKNLAKGLKYEKYIEFKGVMTLLEIKKELSLANVFVQHSIIADDGDMEGTPLSILEASAAGLPVISTNHGGIPDVVINCITGFLVNEHDVDGMAESMIKILNDNDLAKKLGLNGRKKIKSDFHIQKHIDVINSLLLSINNKS